MYGPLQVFVDGMQFLIEILKRILIFHVKNVKNAVAELFHGTVLSSENLGPQGKCSPLLDESGLLIAFRCG